MEGNRKLLTTMVFGLLSLAALALILLFKQFTAETFKAWMTGTASVFGLYQAANVVSKFSPQGGTNGKEGKTEAPATERQAEELLKEPEAKKPVHNNVNTGDGLLGISGYLKRKAAERKKRKEKKDG